MITIKQAMALLLGIAALGATVQLSSAAMDATVTIPSPREPQVIRQAPFTRSIHPSTGSPDSGATLGIHLTTDTLILGLHLGCGPPTGSAFTPRPSP